MKQVPARLTHFVQACGHWCACYAPTNHIADPTATPLPRAAAKCRRCVNQEASEQRDRFGRSVAQEREQPTPRPGETTIEFTGRYLGERRDV